jgi:hypothetical protein
LLIAIALAAIATPEFVFDHIAITLRRVFLKWAARRRLRLRRRSLLDWLCGRSVLWLAHVAFFSSSQKKAGSVTLH